MLQYLVLFGAAVNLLGTGIYLRDILRAKTRPNLVSWVLWSAAPLIATAAALASGVRWAVLPTFMIGFGPLLVIIVAFYKHRTLWHPTKFDYVCGALSLAALILWVLTQQPNLAILLAISSDALAAMPTLYKAWMYPETESGPAYLASIVNMLTTIAALRIFNFAELAFPIYSMIIETSISFAIYRKKIFRAG